MLDHPPLSISIFNASMTFKFCIWLRKKKYVNEYSTRNESNHTTSCFFNTVVSFSIGTHCNNNWVCGSSAQKVLFIEGNALIKHLSMKRSCTCFWVVLVNGTKEYSVCNENEITHLIYDFYKNKKCYKG